MAPQTKNNKIPASSALPRAVGRWFAAAERCSEAVSASVSASASASVTVSVSSSSGAAVAAVSAGEAREAAGEAPSPRLRWNETVRVRIISAAWALADDERASLWWTSGEMRAFAVAELARRNAGAAERAAECAADNIADADTNVAENCLAAAAAFVANPPVRTGPDLDEIFGSPALQRLPLSLLQPPLSLRPQSQLRPLSSPPPPVLAAAMQKNARRDLPSANRTTNRIVAWAPSIQ